MQKLKLIRAIIKLKLYKKILNKKIINNDQIIEILHCKYNFPLLWSFSQMREIQKYQNLFSYSQKSYFLFRDIENNLSLAVSDLNFLPELIDLNFTNIYLVYREKFWQFIDISFSHLNIIGAKYFLKFILFNKMAQDIPYKTIISIFSFIYFIIYFYFPILFHIINNFCFLSQNFLKFYLFITALINKNKCSESICYTDQQKSLLPIYSILIPLYKEAEKLEDIIDYINNFNYECDKLDVKIIIEEDDEATINKINELKLSMKLPSFVQIIILFSNFPKTKPKALNYALPYCKGEYIVVYDAEDIPDPNQLLIAVNMFETLPVEYACLQAKLNFYNADENFLTKFFSLEYSIWFDYILKGLSILNLPMPLGGTSNHFRKGILEKIGMWDAYNVAEDADLGIRLYLGGFKTFILDSYTLEECPTNIYNWIRQRARWIKGYIQTFLVFLINKNSNANISPLSYATIYIFLGFSCYSFFAFPWVISRIISNQNILIDYLWLLNSFFGFAYIYSSIFYVIYSNNKSPTKHKNIFVKTMANSVGLPCYKRSATDMITSLTRNPNVDKFKSINYKSRLLNFAVIMFFPCYFLLHVIASYRAIWEIIFKPFKWNKTVHGVSSYNKNRRIAKT